jgi:predicted PurR-regulated permease PerM
LSDTPNHTKLAHVIVAIIGAGYLIVAGKLVLCPLIFSLLLSILLLPVARYLENKLGLKRALAAFISVFLFVCVLAVVLFLMGTQINSFTQDMPAFKQGFSKLFNQFKTWGTVKFNVDFTNQVNNATAKLFDSYPAVIGATMVSVSSVLFFMVFTFFDTFFLLIYRRLFIEFFISIFSKERAAVYSIIKEVQLTIRTYLIGLFFEMMTVTFVSCFAFWVIGIKYPILMGFITGLFNIIPYVGIFTAFLINIIINLPLISITKILWLVVTVGVIHLIDSNVFLPFIVGTRVRINALITVAGLAIGALMWQIAGIFLSIPVIAIFKIICDRIDSLKPLGAVIGNEIKKRPFTKPRMPKSG